MFEWQRRKGWDVLLSAYCRAFRAEEPVTLYLKVNRINARPEILSEIHYLMAAVLKLEPAATPEIVLLDWALPEEQMAGLYTAADAFVLPTRGEGYGRPFLEAMACGLPVIGTAWGGQSDFLSEAVAYPLPIRGLQPVPDFDPDEWFRGGCWAEPDEAELARLMRHLYTHREEARRKGEAARRMVRAAWDSRHTGAGLVREVLRLVEERGLRHGGMAAARPGE